MADAAKRRATYADFDALPEGTKGHLIDGAIFVPPRPSLPHQVAESELDRELGGPFQRGRGGPGGWVILVEPEVRMGGHAVAPDLAGWRRERMPEIPRAAHATIAPDWVCEIASTSTAAYDRGAKLDVYAAWGVSHAWIVDPDAFTLEVYRLEGRSWVRVGLWSDNARVRAEPFDAIEIDLSVLWTR